MQVLSQQLAPFQLRSAFLGMVLVLGGYQVLTSVYDGVVVARVTLSYWRGGRAGDGVLGWCLLLTML